jgi:hypothetical protein
LLSTKVSYVLQTGAPVGGFTDAVGLGVRCFSVYVGCPGGICIGHLLKFIVGSVIGDAVGGSVGEVVGA